MFHKALFVGALAFSAVAAVMPAAGNDGVITVQSAHDVPTTVDRLEEAVRGAGLHVFDRIDHAAGAGKAGLELRPTELLIFGNPRVGTRLMHCSQRAALDLPMKALAWEDADGKVWLSYNDPAWLAARHDARGCEAVVEKMEGALKKLSREATAP
jgi:uncharacterized protein (DUF302 family)